MSRAGPQRSLERESRISWKHMGILTERKTADMDTMLPWNSPFFLWKRKSFPLSGAVSRKDSRITSMQLKKYSWSQLPQMLYKLFQGRKKRNIKQKHYSDYSRGQMKTPSITPVGKSDLLKIAVQIATFISCHNASQIRPLTIQALTFLYPKPYMFPSNVFIKSD